MATTNLNKNITNTEGFDDLYLLQLADALEKSEKQKHAYHIVRLREIAHKVRHLESIVIKQVTSLAIVSKKKKPEKKKQTIH